MDHRTAVTASQAALDATLKFGVRRLQAAKWEPEPSSEAARELASSQARANGDPWGENPPRTAYAAANLMMGAVLDDLGGLRQLLGDPMPVIGPTVVTRSVIEISSGAWWIMEPGIGVRSRVCRELVASLTSARRAGQVARELQAAGGSATAAVTDALELETRVLDRIADLGIAAPTPGFSPAIETEKADAATDATAAMLAAVLPADAAGTTVYRTYSAVTHGQLYGLMNFMAPGVTSDGSPLLHWHLPPDVLNSTIQMAIAAFSESLKRINTVMGWDRIELDLWEMKVRKIYAA